MLRNGNADHTVGIWLSQRPRQIVVRTCLALWILMAAAHATPIPALSESDHSSLAVQDRSTSQGSIKMAASSVSGKTVLLAQGNLPIEAAADRSGESCAFSSDCYARMKVPEPQSLFLVGSGLLSMAGLIRRRLIR